MSKAFKKQLVDGYEADPWWKRIVDVLEANAKLNQDDSTTLPFDRHENGLIYYMDLDHGRRLCIPNHDNLIKDVFQLIHNKLGHRGYHRCHQRITQGLYIHRLATKLHDYLRHCPTRQLNQTPRHRPYGSLQPIITPPSPFYTITIDFILALPESNEELNCALSVTDKFSKRITFMPKIDTWKAKDWAKNLLQQLDVAGWGLPKLILSDRESKFLSTLWKEIFKNLNVELLYSTAYHPQTDGTSERTNQTVEIALRFYLTSRANSNEWPSILP